MKTVTDAIADINLTASMDFKDYTKGTGVEYTYNKNGAMTKDLNKGISSITYNSLNLPQTVDIKNKTVEGRNEYTYSAAGVKLRAVQRWNPGYSTNPVIGSAVNVNALTETETTDYVGNIIYENDGLKRILVDGGYYQNGNYYFYIRDHLGNNRIVIDQYSDAVQSTQYYPFGNSFAENTNQTAQPYKYNDKELDTRNGLNMYDYSARWKHDWGFTTVDPLAEKYYSWSPYNYGYNNPMRFIDPTGEGPYDRINAARNMTGLKYKQETDTKLRTENTKEALEYMDCSEFVSRVLAADEITDDVQHMNTAGLKDFFEKNDFEQSTTAQVGDIALWNGHTGIVTGVEEGGKVVITHARGVGKLSQESTKALTPQEYRPGTFHGFYRPNNETVDGKVSQNAKLNPASPLFYGAEGAPVTVEGKKPKLPEVSPGQMSAKITIDKDKLNN
ncbi:RHS repeat-associated protein [Dysgonomonas hofstadii]|uniref:RHS repeat-associated protein n=1 Tax=Dysgonomonas hofstadii TaxID=637886 RepID=A0A840CTJ1_9BACT|nr:RHS repeat-associated core domain-containing protein [Dysgonomonas hofstadii]MBB4038331.1 RHS repeat-associated protein [Dysgonomonas hofstadii]